MTRVWIPHEPRRSKAGMIDLTPALKFGRPIFVLPASFAPAVNPGEAREICEAAAKDFDFANDFMACAGGDPLATMLFSTALSVEAAERDLVPVINYLQYSKKLSYDGQRTSHGKYDHIKVELS